MKKHGCLFSNVLMFIIGFGWVQAATCDKRDIVLIVGVGEVF